MKNRYAFSGWVVLFGLATGCVSRTTPPKSIAASEPNAPPPRAQYQAESERERAPYPAEDMRAPAPEGRSGAASGDVAQKSRHWEPQESSRPEMWRRPGLGTVWGEVRGSEITETWFQRAYPTAPAVLTSVRYDDEDGIEALTGLDERYAYPGVFPLRGGVLTLSIVEDDGDPLPALTLGGQQYVVGDEGDSYAIVLTNNSPGRFEIVASVDGLDVIEGQDAEVTKRGYVLAPWGTLSIEGFRDSHETVRAFRFGEIQDSYAVGRGRGADVGVIGVAVFEERGFQWPNPVPQPRYPGPNPFPGRFAPPPGY